MAAQILVRPWKRDDIAAVLPLMRELAKFEDYIDVFAVDEAVLETQGFGEHPNFYCLVALLHNEVVGMLVFYIVPFTARAKPALFVKELFVSDAARGLGAGKALMQAAALEAQQRGCASMKWSVARWNDAALGFYKSLGATNDPVWVEHGLGGDALQRLAEGAA